MKAPGPKSRLHALARLAGAPGILGAMLLFVMLLAALYPEAVFQDKVFVTPDSVAPAGFAVYVASQDIDGALWNPFIFAGMPAFASLSYNPGLYPLSRVIRFAIDHLAFPPLSWLLLHYLLAGLGLFLFIRGRGVGGWLAWIAAAAFLLLPTQVAIGAHGHGSKVMTLAWIPWVLLFLDRLIGMRRPLLDTALLAASVAGLLLTAHIQVVYYGLLAAGLFALARLILLARRGGWRRVSKPLAMGLLALVLAAGSAALLYAPVQEYSHHSIRGVSQGGGADYRYATLWSLHPGEWSTFLLPSGWGFGETSYFGQMPMTNYPNYLGALLLLAALVLFLTGPRRPFDIFFAGLALFATLVAAGSTFPVLYKPLFDLLPWFNRFRVPVMILLLQQLAVVVLFARGMQRAMDDPIALGRLRFLLAIGVAAFVLVAVFGPGVIEDSARDGLRDKLGNQLARWPANEARAYINGQARLSADWLRLDSWRTGALLLLVLAAVELRRRRAEKIGVLLIIAGAGLAVLLDYWPLDRKILHPENHWEMHAKTRLWGPEQSPALQLPPRTLEWLAANLGAQRFWALPGSFFAGNEASARGLASLGGYHAAKLALADSVLKAVPQGGRELLNRFSVRYLLANRALELDENFRLAEQQEEYIYENLAARERLFLSERYRVEPAALSRARLMRGQAEPGLLYLDADPDLKTIIGEGPPGSVTGIDWGLDVLSCRVSMLRPAVLTLADMDYPGWKVTVDGDDRPLLKADGFFRAVALAAGEHEVVFRFEPRSMVALSLIRVLSFGIMGLLLILGLWRASRVRGEPELPAEVKP